MKFMKNIEKCTVHCQKKVGTIGMVSFDPPSPHGSMGPRKAAQVKCIEAAQGCEDLQGKAREEVLRTNLSQEKLFRCV